MAINDQVLAAINLHAILRAMEDLCALDKEASQLVAQDQVSIRFQVPQIPKLTLAFDHGACTAQRDTQQAANMVLQFTSPQHFNSMILGSANPIPLKGFGRIGFLKNKFTALADRLTAYLRPDPARLEKDPEFKRNSTILTAYVAFFALAEIANLDPKGQAMAKGIQDGNILVNFGEIPLHIELKNHQLTAHKGAVAHPLAIMDFKDLDIAAGILGGHLDSYSAIGTGDLRIMGQIHMIDNLNSILALVPGYLA